MREAARVVGRSRAEPAMHVVALVRGDGRVIWHIAGRKVGFKLAQVDDVRAPGRAALHVGEGNERVVLSLVQLVAAGVRERVAVAEREVLAVALPGSAAALD